MSEREGVESGAMDPHERAFRDLLAIWVRRRWTRTPIRPSGWYEPGEVIVRRHVGEASGQADRIRGAS